MSTLRSLHKYKRKEVKGYERSFYACSRGDVVATMPEALKTALVNGVITAKDYAVDGLAVVIPVAMSIFAIKFGINIILNLFHSLTNA